MVRVCPAKLDHACRCKSNKRRMSESRMRENLTYGLMRGG